MSDAKKSLSGMNDGMILKRILCNIKYFVGPITQNCAKEALIQTPMLKPVGWRRDASMTSLLRGIQICVHPSTMFKLIRNILKLSLSEASVDVI